MNFKQDDERRFNEMGKCLTLRPISCPIKGGKIYTLMSRRIPGGFGSGHVREPFKINLDLFNTKTAELLGYSDYLAGFLGFDSFEEYLAEDYNTGNPDGMRKAYFITNYRRNIND